MKRLIYLFALLFITINFSSCNPESLVDEAAPQACCGEGGEIPPPPPPPPPGGGVTGG